MAVLIVQPQWQIDSAHRREKRFHLSCSEGSTEQHEHTRLRNNKRFFYFRFLFFSPHKKSQTQSWKHAVRRAKKAVLTLRSLSCLAVQQLNVAEKIDIFNPLFTAHKKSLAGTSTCSEEDKKKKRQWLWLRVVPVPCGASASAQCPLWHHKGMVSKKKNVLGHSRAVRTRLK